MSQTLVQHGIYMSLSPGVGFYRVDYHVRLRLSALGSHIIAVCNEDNRVIPGVVTNVQRQNCRFVFSSH